MSKKMYGDDIDTEEALKFGKKMDLIRKYRSALERIVEYKFTDPWEGAVSEKTIATNALLQGKEPITDEQKRIFALDYFRKIASVKSNKDVEHYKTAVEVLELLPILNSNIEGYKREIASLQGKDECPDRATELLQLILPMAKGYAYKNDVGSNINYIREAEQYLAVNGTGLKKYEGCKTGFDCRCCSMRECKMRLAEEGTGLKTPEEYCKCAVGTFWSSRYCSKCGGITLQRK
jgi:hypothetical protein